MTENLFITETPLANGKGDSSDCYTHHQSCLHDVIIEAKTEKIVVLSTAENRKMALFQWFVDLKKKT